jgi:hypothetical protein
MLTKLTQLDLELPENAKLKNLVEKYLNDQRSVSLLNDLLVFCKDRKVDMHHLLKMMSDVRCKTK